MLVGLKLGLNSQGYRDTGSRQLGIPTNTEHTKSVDTAGTMRVEVCRETMGWGNPCTYEQSCREQQRSLRE